MKDKYITIFDNFGYRNQMKKLHEECFELLEAIDTYEDVKGDCSDPEIQDMFRAHVVEEMGDVLNVLYGFVYKYKIREEDLNKNMRIKVDRTLDRIKTKYYEK